MARTKIMDEAPSLQDVTCPICLSVLVEPVTLPCKHSLCLDCFKEHVSLTSLACPLCRTRISVWVRKNTKTNTLVDVKLQKAIHKRFPAQLEARLAGRDDGSGISQDVQQRVSEPGEVRQEYESFLAQETQEATQRKNKEEIASIKLIQQLQEEEKKRQQELEQQKQHTAQEDFLLALQLEERDKAQVNLRQKELQEQCAQDEHFIRHLPEVVESRSPQMVSRTKGERGASSSPKGPMDMFLSQKGVVRAMHQSPGLVLSSSDTNTISSQAPPSPPEPRELREPAIKRLPSVGSDSENEEPSSGRHLPSAPGKENMQGRWRGSPMRPGEGTRGRRSGHSSAQRELQLSPDIDSYCIAVSESRQQKGSGTSEVSREGSSAEVEEEEEKEEMKDGGNDCSITDTQVDVSLLLKWEKDKESLAALLYEQQRAEAQLQQELRDRQLAEALQEELDTMAKKVSRTKGSEDEYSLRRRKKPTGSSQHQPGSSKTRSTKRQATLSEVLCKRHKAV